MTLKRRNQALNQALLERKGGPMESKAGAKVKRARMVKMTRREIRSELWELV